MVSKRWVWVTGLSWLFAGLTNAHGHVHYCFDGKEPPAAVHLTDASDHDHEIPGHDPTGEHEDLDVDLPNQVLGKAFKHDAPAIAPMIAWTVSLEAPKGTAVDSIIAAPPAPNPRYYQPPSRGPPR